jgi:hypothetical protein
MRKWWMSSGASTWLALVGVLPVLWSLLAPVYPTREKCDRVKPGMAEREALEILGPDAERHFVVGGHPGATRGYTTPDGFVLLDVNREGRVISCSFAPNLRSAWERIWWLLSW